MQVKKAELIWRLKFLMTDDEWDLIRKLVMVEPENVTYATITLQNYFRMYNKLAGMTGTALTEAEEFSKIYKLEVVPIPPNLEYQAFGKEAPLIEIHTKDEEGYAYSYFAKRDDP